MNWVVITSIQLNRLIHTLKLVSKVDAFVLLHNSFTVLRMAEMPGKFPFMWYYLVLEPLVFNCTYLTSNCRENKSSDQPFPITFQKKKTGFMIRRWLFSITLKEFLKNFNLLQSYGLNSNLSPSKPPGTPR